MPGEGESFDPNAEVSEARARQIQDMKDFVAGGGKINPGHLTDYDLGLMEEAGLVGSQESDTEEKSEEPAE